jgi:retinol dehydrogenase-12
MSGSVRHSLSQTVWIPAPTLTEKNVPDLSHKVLLITGANTGVGYQLAQILYRAHGTVYIAGRTASKCQAAVESIKSSSPDSRGKLETLQLDLADLSSIKASAEDFLARESRLDILWNNAGVMIPPAGSVTAQGHELRLGTNCFGPYLFTKLLTPLLLETAKTAPANSVRVAWAGSLTIDVAAPAGGVTFEDGKEIVKILGSQSANYGASKCGNLFLAKGFAKETEGSGIVSVVSFESRVSSPVLTALPCSERYTLILISLFLPASASTPATYEQSSSATPPSSKSSSTKPRCSRNLGPTSPSTAPTRSSSAACLQT